MGFDCVCVCVCSEQNVATERKLNGFLTDIKSANIQFVCVCVSNFSVNVNHIEHSLTHSLEFSFSSLISFS